MEEAISAVLFLWFQKPKSTEDVAYVLLKKKGFYMHFFKKAYLNYNNVNASEVLLHIFQFYKENGVYGDRYSRDNRNNSSFTCQHGALE